MRQVALDTETTGLELRDGHRIIDIGCVEILDRQLTGRDRRWRLNPEHEIEEGAARVHGVRLEELTGQPRFSEIADDFLEFIRDSQLLIHNAPFDAGFLDAELARLGRGPLAEHCTVLDTLDMARNLHPGRRNNLDALCLRYRVGAAAREQHDALLDAGLLAKVYLGMTSGQVSLLQAEEDRREVANRCLERPPGGLRVLQPDPEQREADRRIRERIARNSSEQS